MSPRSALVTCAALAASGVVFLDLVDLIAPLDLIACRAGLALDAYALVAIVASRFAR
jgi:hypothetical protein